MCKAGSTSVNVCYGSLQFLPNMQTFLPSRLNAEHGQRMLCEGDLPVRDRALKHLSHELTLPSECYRWTCSKLYLLLAESLISNLELQSDLQRTGNTICSYCTVPLGLAAMKLQETPVQGTVFSAHN